MKNADCSRVELRSQAAPTIIVLNDNVRRCDRCTAHTAPHSHTESIESAQVPSSMCPAGTPASPEGDTCVSLSLSRLWVFPLSRAAADQSASFLCTPARFTAT